MWRNMIIVAALVLGLACIALVVSSGSGARALEIGKPVFVADAISGLSTTP